MNQVELDTAEEDPNSLRWQEWEDYNYVAPKRGDVRKGVIVQVRPDVIVVDIGSKLDAIIPARELERLSQEELDELYVGNTIPVFILRSDDREEYILVSLRLAREFRDWEWAQEIMDKGEIIQATVTSYNKGGVVCDVRRLQGFVPASQLASLAGHGHGGYQEVDLAALVGKELPLKVIEVNQKRRRLILSERLAQREWRSQQRGQLLSELEEGQVRHGVVSSLRDFGAFVDLGGIDGLIHLSELSWSRIKHPSEILNVGQEVDVLILRVSPEEQRIGLSLKRVQPDPWDLAEGKYRPGELVRGRITHLTKFGAFAELEPGVEGLIHITELAEGNISDPSQVVQEGEERDILILDVDVSRHRISLSLRQTQSELSDPESVAGDDVTTPPAQDSATEDEGSLDAQAH
jgi:small subunit ribosomal protein S1